MLLIFGSRVSQTILTVVTFVCGYCHVQAPQNVIKLSNRFTLFFVPLFSFSKKHINRCTNCGAETQLSAEQVQHSLEWSASQR